MWYAQFMTSKKKTTKHHTAEKNEKPEEEVKTAAEPTKTEEVSKQQEASAPSQSTEPVQENFTLTPLNGDEQKPTEPQTPQGQPFISGISAQPEKPQEPAPAATPSPVIPQQPPQPTMIQQPAQQPNIPYIPDEQGWDFKKIGLFVGLFLVIAAGAYFGVTWYLQKPQEAPLDIAQNVAITSPTAVPTATPTPAEIDSFKIVILNGSGVPGQAGKLQAKLEDLGLTVSSTANADRYDYEKTIVYAPETVPPAFFEKLDLGITSYDRKTEIPTLVGAEGADVVVIIGAE